MQIKQLAAYLPSNEKAVLYNTVKRMSKLVLQQNSLEEEISLQGDNATDEIKAVSVVLRATIDTTCVWVSYIIIMHVVH